MKFSDYIKENVENTKNANIDNIDSCFDNGSIDMKKASEMQNLIDQYKDFSNEKLLNEFIKQSSMLKQNGMLTQDKRMLLKNNIFPYLTEEQKVGFNKIMDLVSDV